MRRNLFVFSLALSALGISGCGQKEPVQQSEVKLNITIDPKKIDYVQAESVFNYFDVLSQVKSSNVLVADVIGLVSMLEPTIGSTIEAAVSPNFPNGMDFSCDKQKCQGVASGKATSIVLAGFEVGGIKDPVLQVASKIEVSYRVDGKTVLEVCRIRGIKVVAGITGELDGAYLELGSRTVDKILVDVGMFGSYPSNKCN